MDTTRLTSWMDQAQPILVAFGAAGFPVAAHPVKIYPVETAARAAPSHLQENIL